MGRLKAAKPEPDHTHLIHEIITSKFGRKVLGVVADDTGRNSKVYFLTLEPAQDAAQSVAQVNRAGVVPLPLNATKVVMRITNPGANLNDEVQVENEVASMALAREALAGAKTPLVPDVYGWSSVVDGVGWILMELMSGSALPYKTFMQLDQQAKETVITQMAQILEMLQQYELPASVKGYGGLKFADDGSIINGPTAIHGATSACSTYHELYTEYLQTQLRHMQQCDVVNGWKDTTLPARITAFTTQGFQPLLQKICDPLPRRTLVHADFDIHNMLYNPATNTITALLDFQFSHVASPADEYFYSLDQIHSLVGPRILYGGGKHLREYLLNGFDESVAEREGQDEVDWKVAALTDRVFRAVGVTRPVDVGQMEQLADLYWFIQHLSPGEFFLPRFRARVSKDRVRLMRVEYGGGLGRALEMWGY